LRVCAFPFTLVETPQPPPPSQEASSSSQSGVRLYLCLSCPLSSSVVETFLLDSKAWLNSAFRIVVSYSRSRLLVGVVYYRFYSIRWQTTVLGAGLPPEYRGICTASPLGSPLGFSPSLCDTNPVDGLLTRGDSRLPVLSDLNFIEREGRRANIGDVSGGRALFFSHFNSPSLPLPFATIVSAS